MASIKMPFEPIGGSEGAMMAELKSAYAAKDPILMMIWQPHWIFADLDLKFVTWNPTTGECVEESQEKDTACGFQQAAVHKVVWGGFEKKWPAAYKMVSNLELTNADENWAIFEVDNNGRDVADVAKEWLEKMKRVGSHGLTLQCNLKTTKSRAVSGELIHSQLVFHLILTRRACVSTVCYHKLTSKPHFCYKR